MAAFCPMSSPRKRPGPWCGHRPCDHVNMRRKGWAASIALVGTVALIAALAAFQPWKLWVDQKAADPDVAVPTAGPSGTAGDAGPVKVFEGSSWHSYSH